MRITVVGGGVIGLSCALRLAQAEHDVKVISAHEPAETTSTLAGGLIYPPGMRPAGRCAEWMAASVAEFGRLAGRSGLGIRLLSGRLLHREPVELPVWAEAVPDIARETEVPEPWTNALAFTTPVVNTPVYLGWLAARVARTGARIEHRMVESLEEASAGTDLVVNAAGLGAGELAGDPTVAPVRGQVVYVKDPGLTEWTVDEDAPVVSYVIPHGEHVVCGGTEEAGRDGVEPDPEIAEDILRRCRELVPALADAEVLGTRAGLRPGRPEVRLERVDDVIHCYGHGGAGITLSWGCADEVAALALG